MLKRIAQVLTAVLMLAGVSTSVFAQSRTIKGQVLDEGGLPLMGVAVMQQGSTNGVVTDIDGNFSITVASDVVVLDVTSLGYVSQTVKLSPGQAVVTITLAEDSTMLDETVVVGYGTQKKVNLTGAVTAVDSKSLEDRTAHNLSTMLQGSVAGLNISTSSGNPGSTGTLNIRGITSINDAAPLVLIDGAPGEIDRVNPNDVESISVIKDASAAAVYGARGTYGVILVTTKKGTDKGGKATVKYSGRYGWEAPTTSTDYESRGYWSAYTVDKFWIADSGNRYTTYTDYDYGQLLARVNDKVEDPSRPWIVEDYRNGRKQWVYYCNTDWYHELYSDQHPTMQQSVSVSGGNKDVNYYISGNYDRQQGVVKVNPDVYQKYNLRAKFDFKINKYARMSNNTSFYSSLYDWIGSGDVEDSFAYASRHALASFPLKNPDGSWTYASPMIRGNYNIGNGRHIVFGEGTDRNLQRRTDFTNTTQLVIKPVEQFSLTGNFTYRQQQNMENNRNFHIPYRSSPDQEMQYYGIGSKDDELNESVRTYYRMSGNVFATYEDTFAGSHHLTATAGMNLETVSRKDLSASGQNLISDALDDLTLVGPDATGTVITTVGGGKTSSALLGFFGRINYDYNGRYLFEVSGRYDGSSRFAKGHRWGFFPSASAGWRISEEPFFSSAKRTVNNLKLRASFGSLGNQQVSDFAYMQLINIYQFNTSGHYSYSFNEGSTNGKYASLSAPVSGSLTWETAQQYDLGLDAAFLGNRLEFTGDLYVRNTLNMLTAGQKLPGVYGADAPKINAANLSTRGYELALSWRDSFKLAGKPFGYSFKATLSDYRTYVTKYDNNPNRLLSDYIAGERVGEIWGYRTDGIFATDKEAADWDRGYYVDDNGNEVAIPGAGNVTYWKGNRIKGGMMAGDLKFLDQPTTPYYKTDENGEYILDENGQKILDHYGYDAKISAGANSLDDHGDLVKLGNSLASLQYGFTVAADWLGFDVSAFFQGTGNHYWYPTGINMAFWGPYGYSYMSFIPRDFYLDKCWTADHTDAYFPRPRAYSSTGGYLSLANDRYLQNLRYLRLKNLSVGYTVPQTLTRKAAIDKIRIYFSGENLCYWSPLTKATRYLDPEAAFQRNSDNSSARNEMYYPWQKTFMFGIDIQF
ncbi:MAG: TonB-dependent receptor [Bacteroidales bacterium]|nr:TonB-dependent receptor [Bacteroidales bacterium]